MNFGFRFGFGSGYSLPITVLPTAYFNGVFTPAQIAAEDGTYTGGPTVFADNLGVLQTAPSGTPALQGMRLATTVANGAVLGPELIPSFDFTTWRVLGTPVVTLNAFTTTTSGGVANQLIGVFVAGKKLKITVHGETTLPAGSLVFRNDIANTEVYFASPNQGVFTVDLELTVTVGVGLYIRHAAAGTTTISLISIRELIPIYYDTSIDGTPLLPSVPQPTRTFDAGFTTSTPGPTYKKYTRTNPAVDLPGYLCEPARTNKVTCRKANPVDLSSITKSGDAAAVLSVVDDTAALTAAGLIGICNSGKVYKLDNSLGITQAQANIGGTPGNTNVHSSSMFVRGSGDAIVRAFNDSGYPTTTLTSNYVRVLRTATTTATTSQLAVFAAAGSIVYFILPQLEEGPFCTSPICKLSDGSDPLTAITRQGTVLSFPTAGKIRPNNMAFLQTVVPNASGQSGVYLFGNYTDANNYTAVIVDVTTITYRKRIAGVNTDATVSITHAKDTPLQILRVGTTLGMRLAVMTYSGGAWTDGALNGSDGAKANAIIAANYQLGALNSSSQFTGNLSELDTLFIPDGIADPLAWAKQQWGLPA